MLVFAASYNYKHRAIATTVLHPSCQHSLHTVDFKRRALIVRDCCIDLNVLSCCRPWTMRPSSSAVWISFSLPIETAYVWGMSMCFFQLKLSTYSFGVSCRHNSIYLYTLICLLGRCRSAFAYYTRYITEFRNIYDFCV